MSDHYLLNPGTEFYQRFKTRNHLPLFPKNIDVTPGSIEPVINRQEGLTLVWVMKWGLIPFWAKERGVGSKMFNVKAESLTTKLGFKRAFKTHRCLIPANGFYLSSNFFSLDYRPLFSFAGIYDIWEEPVSGHEVYTYAIITTEANSTIKPISDRMPVILRQSDEQVWLNERTPEFKLESLLHPSEEILTITHQ
jgi:putative SOS response-associated peptidase YedK